MNPPSRRRYTVGWGIRRVIRSALLLVLAVGAGALMGRAATINWVGPATGNHSWSAPSNWQGGRVPGAGDDVVIQGEGPSLTVQVTGVFTVRSIDSSATLRVVSDIGANAHLTVGGAFLNRGVLRLESLRSDRTTAVTVNGGPPLENRGWIQVVAENGGGRRFTGGMANRGRIEVEAGIEWVVENAEREFTAMEGGRIDAAGVVSIYAGRVHASGGQWTGTIRALNAAVVSDATFTDRATLRVLGARSTLLSNASGTLTLWLDSDVGNNTTLTAVAGAYNAGRIVLGSGRSDRTVRLDLSSGAFTNLAQAVIGIAADAGGSREIGGHLVNRGTLLATNYPVDFSGTYEAEGGVASGDVRFRNIRLLTTRPASVTNEMRLFGANNVLATDLASNAVVRVVSDTLANGVLTLETNLVVNGTLRLESERGDRTTSIQARGRRLENRGTIIAVAAGGGGRGIVGNVFNLGRLVVEAGITLNVDNDAAAFSQFAGRLEALGSLVVDRGTFEAEGGVITGEVRLYNLRTRVGAGLSVPTQVRVLGARSELLGNASPAVTLFLDTDIGNQTMLTAQPGAVNRGRIVLGSSRADRESRLEAPGGLVNAAGAVVEVSREPGGGRAVHGVFINQGLLSAGDGTLVVTGTYRSDGGRVVGDVRFVDILLDARQAPVEPLELQLFGGGNRTLGWIITNLVVRVISEIGSNGALTLGSNAVNQGVIVLESQRSDRVSLLGGADGVVRNGAGGRLISRAAGGGSRRVTSALLNQGWIELEHSLEISAASANHVNEGHVELGGKTLALVGRSFENARTGRITGSGEIDARAAAFTNAGLIAPGSSPGRMLIRGGFTQADTGGVDFEISDGSGAGIGHDLLEIQGGRAVLQGGTLSVRVPGTFIPAADVRFRVVTADGGVTGRFARTPNLQVLPDRYFQTEYLPNALDMRTMVGVNSTLPPSIVVHPVSQEVEERGAVQFVVGVNGTGPFSYQWRRNGVVIPGATGNTLSLSNVAVSDFGDYDVVVSNGAGSATSETARLNQKTTSGGGGKQDYGDAPDGPYPTTQANNGASHKAQADFVLGTMVDGDSGTQQNATATADGADEDGVRFLDSFVPGQNVRIEVVHFHSPNQAAGRLSAWVDWNRDGDWADAGERIITHQPLVSRTNLFVVTVPGAAVIGTTFSRFRLYPDNYYGYEGPSEEQGEVEDYAVDIVTGEGGGPGGQGTHDFGDAPDSYRTTLAQDGARHLPDPALMLGAARDLEADGQPSPLALADDLAGSPDDEDGVTGWPVLRPGGVATLSITVVGNGRVDAWFDFGGDGSFGEAGDRVLTAVAFGSETKTLTVPIPATAKPGGTFARFRLSSAGVNSWYGAAPNGEVEDYPIVILASEKDWGDAPDGYPTLLKDDGPRHTLAEGFHLGKSVDAEVDGQPNVNATGDDLSPAGQADDEDGVSFSTALIPGQTAEIRVEASASGRLDAWIDFDGDRDWSDAVDRIFLAQALSAGANTLVFTVPANAVPGQTYARFRLSRQGLNTFTGEGGDGEVEDYRVVIEQDSGCDLGCTGRDFWIAFPGNYAPDVANPVEPRLRISGAAGTTVSVSVPGLVTNVPTTILGAGITVSLPAAVDLGTLNDAILRRGVHVTASAPVRVQAISQVDFTSDGYLALPTEVLTGEYVVSAYPNTQVGVPEISGSQFVVVATVPNTRVLVTPSYETGMRMVGIPYSVVLTNAGDCYQLRNTNDAPADLSGTLIEADQPVSVFGGHVCASVHSPSLFYCDYLVEQLLPTERLGTDFHVAPLASRSGGETVRVVAARNNTTLTVGSSAVVLTNRGDVFQALLPTATRIRSDKPVQVAQFAASSDHDGVRNSDPFMVLTPARAHFSTNHTFATGATNFLTHHVSVIVPGSVTSMILDGTVISPGFTNIASSTYKYAHLTVSPGFHTLTASAPFGAIVYGWAEYESYGWPSCLFFGDTTPPRLVATTNRVVLPLGQPPTDVPCTLRMPDLSSRVTVRDNCGIPDNPGIVQDPPGGTLVGVGTHEVTLSVEDNRGNVGRVVIVVEVVDPNPGGAVSLVCPKDMTVRCDDENGAVVNYEVEALRGCTPIAVDCQPPSGSHFPIGTTTVICRITEPGVPVQTCAFKVTVDCAAKRTVKIQPPFRPAPTPENPDPPAEIAVEWEAEAGVVLEVSEDLRAWTDVPTVGNRHVIKILRERGKFFRIRAR